MWGNDSDQDIGGVNAPGEVPRTDINRAESFPIPLPEIPNPRDLIELGKSLKLPAASGPGLNQDPLPNPFAKTAENGEVKNPFAVLAEEKAKEPTPVVNPF